jgi:hypothetical protein
MSVRYFPARASLYGYESLPRGRQRETAGPRTSYRSSSADLSAPSLRLRDRSVDFTSSTRSSDFSINGIERMRTRPKIAIRDDEERSQEYQNILAKAEKIKDKDINKDLDMSKDQMSDIINNSDLTTKTINAINKEVFNKTGKQEKKNYSWRKDMEGYEAEWEKLNARSNSRTRENLYKDKLMKTEDTFTKPKQNPNSTPRTVRIEIKPTYRAEDSGKITKMQPNHVGGNRSVYELNKKNVVNSLEEPKAPKRGSWRKDIERYEEDLELKKLHKETQRKMDSYNSHSSSTNKDSERKSSSLTTEKHSFVKIPVKVIKTESEVTGFKIANENISNISPNTSDSSTEKLKPSSQQTSEFKQKESEDERKHKKDAEKIVSFTVKLNSLKNSDDTTKTTEQNTFFGSHQLNSKTTQEKDIKTICDSSEATIRLTNKPKKEEKQIHDSKLSDMKVSTNVKSIGAKKTEKKSEYTTQSKIKSQEMDGTVKIEPKWKKKNIKDEKEAENVPKTINIKQTSKSEKTEPKNLKLSNNKNYTKSLKDENVNEPNKYTKPSIQKKSEGGKETTNIPREEQELLDHTKSENNRKENVISDDAKNLASALEPSSKSSINLSTENDSVNINGRLEKEEDKLKQIDGKSENDKTIDEITKTKQEEEEEHEDISGMKTMRKETDNKFADMEAEFEAGRSKLAALRAKIRRTRENAKASSVA